MTDAVAVGAMGSAALVLVALVQGFVAKKVSETQTTLKEVETKVDGRLTELLELTRKSSRAEGVKEAEKRPTVADEPQV